MAALSLAIASTISSRRRLLSYDRFPLPLEGRFRHLSMFNVTYIEYSSSPKLNKRSLVATVAIKVGTQQFLCLLEFFPNLVPHFCNRFYVFLRPFSKSHPYGVAHTTGVLSNRTTERHTLGNTDSFKALTCIGSGSGNLRQTDIRSRPWVKNARLIPMRSLYPFRNGSLKNSPTPMMIRCD
jgi:hypothetical protein